MHSDGRIRFSRDVVLVRPLSVGTKTPADHLDDHTFNSHHLSYVTPETPLGPTSVVHQGPKTSFGTVDVVSWYRKLFVETGTETQDYYLEDRYPVVHGAQ